VVDTFEPSMVGPGCSRLRSRKREVTGRHHVDLDLESRRLRGITPMASVEK